MKRKIIIVYAVYLFLFGIFTFFVFFFLKLFKYDNSFTSSFLESLLYTSLFLSINVLLSPIVYLSYKNAIKRRKIKK